MSDQTVKEIYSNEEYCKQELLEIRKAWGDKTKFNARVIEASRWSLGFMLLYAPESLQPMVDAAMAELDMREQFFLGLR